MTDPVLAAGFHLLPALLWAIITRACWRVLHERRPQGQLFRVLPALAGLMTLHYLAHAVIELTPTQLGGRAPELHRILLALISVSQVGSAALFRHLVPLLAIRERAPSRRWLAVHYGIAAVFALLAVLLPWEGPTSKHVELGYGIVMLALGIRDMQRFARAGTWPRQFDFAFNVGVAATLVVLGAAAMLGLGGVLSAPVSTGEARFPVDISLFAHTAFGLVTAAPFCAVMLAETVRGMLVTSAMIVATAAVYFGGPRVAAAVTQPEARRLVDAGAVLVLIGVFSAGVPWLEAAIVRTLFRQSRRALAELQGFLARLPPERGTLECCRLALDEVSRVMRPRGLAILLDDGAAVEHGALSVGRLAPIWPRGTAAGGLPTRAFGLYSLRDPTLREALASTGVGLVVPVTGPRRRWGYLFVSAGVLGQATRDEYHVETLEIFGAQLAVVLDAAELLDRAVAVERSLAHAEKLAAIGETAARIAHDIRNPVTAARSLAQQLVREPASPFAAEHALILEELERVERQVVNLLRFARREELDLAPVDLAEIVRATVDSCRPRLESAGIAVDLDVRRGAPAHADRERLRQVIINLIENAADALADGAAVRRLGVAVSSRNGHAVIRVADTGPGVPDDALPRLFEPFFSLKPHGTGLGLAIAKRTIDAHRGRIAASRGPDGGMVVEVELPLAEHAA